MSEKISDCCPDARCPWRNCRNCFIFVIYLGHFLIGPRIVETAVPVFHVNYVLFICIVTASFVSC